MDINIIVNGGAPDSQASYSAFRFAEQLVVSEHRLVQVFFYRAGVNQANTLQSPSGDEFNGLDAWPNLAKANNVKLIACISAAERRGVIGAEQQAELGVESFNLHPAFEVAGLGQMHAASLAADRTVTFK